MLFTPSTLALSTALTMAAAPAEAPPPASVAAPTVSGVTVQPTKPAEGKTVSGMHAAPMASPNFKAEDAQPAPRALSLGDNAAAGVQAVDTAPPAGLPASMDQAPPRADLGVTAVF